MSPRGQPSSGSKCTSKRKLGDPSGSILSKIFPDSRWETRKPRCAGLWWNAYLSAARALLMDTGVDTVLSSSS
jgi:hypothetical protein